MNLKEAFRYQNKIQALMCDAEEILRNRANITKVTNTNLRHKVMPEASDETVVEIPETEYCGKITDVALFLVFLLEEKSALAAAIRRAKNNLDIDMDSEVALNSARQTVAEIFRTMNGIRSSEQTIANGGTGYRFNTDGNQVTYRCDVRRVTTINYDRNVIRAELGRLDRAADEMSAKLDICMVTSSVDYTPPFDVNSGFADAFENYLENRRATRRSRSSRRSSTVRPPRQSRRNRQATTSAESRPKSRPRQTSKR